MRHLLGLALATGLIVSVAPAALADNLDRTMYVENNTRLTMVGLYASNRDEDDWLDNLIADSAVYPGEGTVVDTDDFSGYCIYDLMAEFETGDVAYWWGVNVCEEYEWAVNPNLVEADW